MACPDGRIDKATKEVSIAVIVSIKTGDLYFGDSYVSVVEALKHAGYELGLKPKITWMNAEEFDEETLKNFDGIIILRLG